MAGHSHWANIKHKKAAKDAKRGKESSKLVRAIMVAAKGGSDPNFNIRLGHVIAKAKSFGVSRDAIERAVKKGAGELEGESLTEISYEGYGHGGVAMIVECVTDKTTRTQPELRKIFESRGGKIGSAGSTAWMFKKRGIFGFPTSVIEEEPLMELALDAGADDVVSENDAWEVSCDASSYGSLNKALNDAGIKPEVADLMMIADNEVECDLEAQIKNLRLMEALEDHDDVQNVYAAFSPSEEAIAGMDS